MTEMQGCTWKGGRLAGLSEENWRKVEEFRDDMTKLGLSTDPPDKPAAEDAIRRIYRERGVEPPAEIHWVVSPLEGLRLCNKLDGNEGAQLKWYTPAYGAQEVHWLSFYGAVMSLGLESGVDLEPHFDYIKHGGGWWWAFEEAAVLCERPSKLKIDPQGRLHCEDGPAVYWRDGYSLYSWRGTTVPKEWIENKDQVDPRLALSWENIEQRRALAEIIGWGRVLEQLDAKVIDQDSDPEVGVLLEVELPGSDQPERFLKVRCGTGRDFVIPVPAHLDTALEANAWTYDVPPEVIRNLEVRT